MVNLAVLPPLESLVGAGVLLLFYGIYWELTVGASRRRLIREKGCLPVEKNSNKKWDFLGLQNAGILKSWLKEHTLLENRMREFGELGNTFWIKLLGRAAINTIEPENLKAVQALDFKSWGLPGRRKTAFIELLGPGIFDTDGLAWQHSRDMLRPNFVRSQVGDLETFETHVNHLIQRIPSDGSTVDLQELFFRLTIDSATEFLFGESTNSLAPGVSSSSAQAFADAFNRGQEFCGNRARFGQWLPFVADTQYDKDRKCINGMCNPPAPALLEPIRKSFSCKPCCYMCLC